MARYLTEITWQLRLSSFVFPGNPILYWKIEDQDSIIVQSGSLTYPADIGDIGVFHLVPFGIAPIDIDSYTTLRLFLKAADGVKIGGAAGGTGYTRQSQPEVKYPTLHQGHILYINGDPWEFGYYVSVVMVQRFRETFSNMLVITPSLPDKAINPSPANAEINVSTFTENLTWTPAPEMVDQRIMFDNGSGSFVDVGHTTESSISVKDFVHWPLWRHSTFRWRVDTKFLGGEDFEVGDVWQFTTKDFESPSTPFPAADIEDVPSRIGWLGVTIPTDAEEIEFWKDSSVFASPLDKLGSVEITDEMREAGETVMLAFLRDSWDLSSYVTWPINGYETNWHVKVKYPQRLSTYIQETDFTFYTEPLYTPASFEGSTPNEEYEDEESGQTFIPGNGSCAVPLKTIMVIAKENKLFYME